MSPGQPGAAGNPGRRGGPGDQGEAGLNGDLGLLGETTFVSYTFCFLIRVVKYVFLKSTAKNTIRIFWRKLTYFFN